MGLVLKHDAKHPCQSSGIGGITDTQECVDLCAKFGIWPETTVRPVEALSQIYEDLDKANESGTRYVLDLKRSLAFADSDAEGGK